MNIKTADGKFVALDVPASAKRFDELKVGDKVGVTYNNNVMVRLKPAGEAAVDTPTRRPPWVRSAARGHGVDGADDDGNDCRHRQKHVVDDFVGPNGWKYSRRVVDPKVFDQVKAGDKVDITWNTEVSFAVE